MNNAPVPPPAAPEVARSKVPLYIMLGILGIGLVLLGLTFPAKAKLEAAQTKAEELQNGDGNKNWPLETMKAIGRTPMVKESDSGELTQVYRWTGGIKTYELRVTFSPVTRLNKGVYANADSIEPLIKPFFMMDRLEGYIEAYEATGSTYTSVTDNQKPQGQLITQAMVPRNFHRPEAMSELNLTADQQQSWDSAVDTMIEAKKNAYQIGKPVSTLMKGLRLANDEFTETVRGFLSNEQFAAYQEAINKRGTVDGGRSGEVAPGNPKGGQPQGKSGGGSKSGGFGQPPAELGLSDEQKTKWTQASATLRTKMDAARSSGGGRVSFGEAIQEFRNELKTFLTAEQFAQMEKLFAGRGGGKKK